MTTIRKFYREHNAMFFSIVLNEGDVLEVNPYVTEPGTIKNITIIPFGSIFVERPDGTSYEVNASDTPVNFYDVLPGAYKLLSQAETKYICVGEIPIPGLIRTRFEYMNLPVGAYPQGMQSEFIVMEGVLEVDDNVVEIGDIVPPATSFNTLSDVAISVLYHES